MYIRVKRNKTTYFIQCDPTEKTLEIKQKLNVLIDQPVNDQRLILVGTGEVLEDSKSLAEQKVVITFLLTVMMLCLWGARLLRSRLLQNVIFWWHLTVCYFVEFLFEILNKFTFAFFRWKMMLSWH
jgi:hypothetical protein